MSSSITVPSGTAPEGSLPQQQLSSPFLTRGLRGRRVPRRLSQCHWHSGGLPVLLLPLGSTSFIPSPVPQERPRLPAGRSSKVLAVSAEGWWPCRQGCHLLTCPQPQLVALTVSFASPCQGIVACPLQLCQPGSCSASVPLQGG